MTIKRTINDTILKLLRRPNGATIEQLQKAIGWKPHSIRAALTGLRKQGHAIKRDQNAKEVTIYCVAKGT
jgi:hypothetical protein